MVTKPTMFLAGEAGSEHVSITPHGGKTGNTFIINITSNASVMALEELKSFVDKSLKNTLKRVGFD